MKEIFGKIVVAKDFKTCPKSNKSPNLVTLDRLYLLVLEVTLAQFVPSKSDQNYLV